MNQAMPRTPFATGLSRSARETERRIRNIFAGPNRQPPLPLVVLTALAVLLCCNLVSCQDPGGAAQPRKEPSPLSGTVPQPDRSEKWISGKVDISIAPENLLWETFQFLTREEAELVQNLPAAELPRRMADPAHAARQDYWHDMLLPAAFHEAEDVTVYFVAAPGSMPDREPRAVPTIGSLYTDGVVLRRGDRTAYFPLEWGINAKFAQTPLFLVKDLNGDSRPEAALSLAWGEGTGAYCECLYIFDLDTLTYTVPDYTDIPLSVTYNEEKTTARLTSGELEQEVDLTQWTEPFQGTVYVGEQVRFFCTDGQIFCRLDLDFSGMLLGYLARADFPVVFEDGAFRLGPAVRLSDELTD